MFPQSRHSGSSHLPQQLKFTTSDSCDRIKDEFQLLQAQYHSLKLECDKLASEKSEMQRHYVMGTLWSWPHCCLLTSLSPLVLRDVVRLEHRDAQAGGDREAAERNLCAGPPVPLPGAPAAGARCHRAGQAGHGARAQLHHQAAAPGSPAVPAAGAGPPADPAARGAAAACPARGGRLGAAVAVGFGGAGPPGQGGQERAGRRHP